MLLHLVLTIIELNTGPPPVVQYFGKLEKHCHWGNEVKLYEHHVDALFAMFWHKKAHIKYLCTFNKTFAKPGQRTSSVMEKTRIPTKVLLDATMQQLALPNTVYSAQKARTIGLDATIHFYPSMHQIDNGLLRK